MTLKINERALELYKYLLETQRANLEDIMRDLDHLYKRSEEHSTEHNSTAYRRLRKDIEEINKSNAQYVILPIKNSGRTYGYRLAESNEAILEMAKNYHNRALRYMRKEYALKRKAQNNDQLRMTRDGVTVIRSVIEE